MRKRRYVREFTEDEKKAIESGLRSQDSFVLRRSQILLFCSEGQSLDEIATRVGYHPESVRLVIKRFEEEGICVLKKGSRHPLTSAPIISEENAQTLKEFLRRGPREFNKDSSLWTLELLAEVSYEEALSPRKVSYETIRTTLKALDVNWKRAKHWIASSDPHYAYKKKRQEHLIEEAKIREDWAIGFQAEVWWSGGAVLHIQTYTVGAQIFL